MPNSESTERERWLRSSRLSGGGRTLVPEGPTGSPSGGGPLGELLIEEEGVVMSVRISPLHHVVSRDVCHP